MTDISRNLILLSDGTGNSASKPFKTNVWRLYQAIDLTDGTQVAVFGDGVGTSTVKVLRVIGIALGVGVKRNVLNLYKSLCRNYDDGDRIWAFGFSRGAFTIRVLAGLIHHEGLVDFESEAELNRNAIAAYRAYRKKAFPTIIPWVVIGRYVRDALISGWNLLTASRSYKEVKDTTFRRGRNLINIHFLGVWDTVVAYGLPVDELTQAVDKWVWPMKFRDDSLLPNVQHARHALSLDDERRTFHPIPWNEREEAKLRQEASPIEPDRLRQVWFAGVHSDVGGGYPDDGLSFVPLCWMIDEASKQGLRFEPSVVDEYVAVAAPTGRVYDSRAGFGVLWRYQPRDAQLLMGQGITPVVHGSVMLRMTCGNDGYAPISLPEAINVLPHHGPPVAFDIAAVTQALIDASPANEAPSQDNQRQHRILSATKTLVTAANAQRSRSDLFKLVLDTVWWRRLVYFLTLALFIVAAAYPLLAKYLRIEGVTDDLNDRAGGPIGWAVGLVKGFLPGIAEPWTAAVVRNPAGAAIILVALLASLAFSSFLQRRICDRARAAWNVRDKVDGIALDRLRLTGQRHALVRATLVFVVLGIGVALLHGPSWLLYVFMAAAVVCGCLGAFRWFRPAGAIDPAKPGLLLSLARKVRTSSEAVAVYRFVAQKIMPAGFLVVSAVVVLSVGHRLLFDLASTGGTFCQATKEVKDQSAQKMKEPSAQKLEAGVAEDERLGEGAFTTSSICHPTGLRLVAGRKYRIRIEMNEGVNGEWFDKAVRTDVAGFTSDSGRHFVASPLKRWWTENWFQPIARIGEVGNYEHVLQPAAPLPVLDYKKCRPSQEPSSGSEAIQDTSSPATDEFRKSQLECESRTGVRPTRVLISDITANATGELFLYVNDAVLTLPRLTGIFYKNNSGTAKVTAVRILAPKVIEIH